MGLRDRGPHGGQPLAFFRRNEVNGCKFQKSQPGLDGPVHQLALISVYRVPFVDRQDHGAPTLQDKTSNVRILIGHPLGGIQKQQDHVGRLNRLQGFDD